MTTLATTKYNPWCTPMESFGTTVTSREMHIVLKQNEKAIKAQCAVSATTDRTVRKAYKILQMCNCSTSKTASEGSGKMCFVKTKQPN